MAIRIIEGKIGSGKSYFAVNHVVKNYYTWHTEALSWVPKEFDGRIVEIYSNFEGFALGHDLMYEIEKVGGLVQFFNVDYQKKFVGNRKVIYLIDEAQSPQFFHRKFYNPDVFFFFQYHRHLGCDIYLLTQDIWSLARELRELPEFVVRVLPRVRSLTGEFRYQYMLGDEVYKTVSLRPSKNIFSLYKSQTQKEVENIGSASRRYAVFVVLLVLAAILIFKYGFLAIFVPDVSKTVEAKTSIPLKKQVAQIQGNNKGSNPVIVQASNNSTDLTGFKLQTQVDLVEVTITGILSIDDVNSSLILFEDSEGREFKLTLFEFDRLCKCSSFARLRSGDTLEIEKPPTGTRYIKNEKSRSTSSDPVVAQFPS